MVLNKLYKTFTSGNMNVHRPPSNTLLKPNALLQQSGGAGEQNAKE